MERGRSGPPQEANLTSSWQVLIGNLAVVALFVLGWANARFLLRSVPGAPRAALLGLVMGLGAATTMGMAAQVMPGHLLDLRLSLVAVSAFLGGPLAALVTLAVALPCRALLGGDGMVAGMSTMAAMALAGLACRMLVGPRPAAAWHSLGLGISTAAIAAGGILIIGAQGAIHNIVPLTVLNLVATVLACVVILHSRRFTAEHDLLDAALTQAPDFTYVKDRYGRFAAVNAGVARFHGFAHPKEMIGKTDFDISPPERAQALFDNEQAMLASGQPQVSLEEQLPDDSGAMRWYTTSKVPLRAVNGETIGLAGITRDITEDRQLRQDLMESRNTLSYALAEMSDGLAMFDPEGRIILCNERYSASFPLSGPYRRPGASLRDILAVVIVTGEQINVPKGDEQGWIDRVMANLKVAGDSEVHLMDGRWLQVRTRPTSEGRTMVVVTDVTRIKQAELALHSATDQLRHLVRTDGLTGLLNRRAFDDAMEAEIARSARTAAPMSLLMIDVDHFKAYNDHYGHPAGDDCLKRVAEHLRQALKRPADLAARYGGEEFAAILPDTDEDGAYLVAESFRRALVEARLPHQASERGILTASVGVATYMPDNPDRSAAAIIQTADEALYSAKAAGRDRVFGRRVNDKRARYGTHD